MKKTKFFRKDIAPSCTYCKYGTVSGFDKKILCVKNGIFDEALNCKHFVYDPTKRIPKAPLNNFSFDDELFRL